MKKHIPNLLTCSNLLCGTIATLQAFDKNFQLAFFFICFGAFFDFFDGLVARILHVSSDIGKELDSLADLITFGFAPATIIYSIMESIPLNYESNHFLKIVPYSAFLIVVFSALRLANFNIDKRQTQEFIGLPTPANALFWSSLGILSTQIASLHTEWTWAQIYIILIIILLSSWLLVSEVRMFALKFKNFNFKDNKFKIIFLLICSLILILFKTLSFVFIIPLYIISSLIYDFMNKFKV